MQQLDLATHDCIVQWLFKRVCVVGAKGSLLLQITTDPASLHGTSHESHWPHGNKSLQISPNGERRECCNSARSLVAVTVSFRVPKCTTCEPIGIKPRRLMSSRLDHRLRRFRHSKHDISIPRHRKRLANGYGSELQHSKACKILKPC